jgi:NADH dehydrogenase
MRALAGMGVTVRTNAVVTEIATDYVTVKDTPSNETTLIPTHTVLWGAGVKASPLAGVVAGRTGAGQDRSGRVIVGPDLTLPNHPDIFVIGDMAHCAQDGQPLPGVAQVAMQQGMYVASVLQQPPRQANAPFRYRDKGLLAVIGRNKAVADIGNAHFSGLLAWLIWVFVHVNFLIEFDNKLKVMTQWGLYYLTRRQGARLITDETGPVWRRLVLDGRSEVGEAADEQAAAP